MWKERTDSQKLTSKAYALWHTCLAPLHTKLDEKKATISLVPPLINKRADSKNENQLNLTAIGKWASLFVLGACGP